MPFCRIDDITPNTRLDLVSRAPGILKAMSTLSASGPSTSFTTGDLMGASGAGLYSFTGLAFI